MKDSERLNLLKEISGASFYEKQREDTIKLLNETNQKKITVVDTIDSLNTRLQQLSEQKNELEAFDSIEKQLVAIDYLQLKAQLNSSQNSIDKIESKLENLRAELERDQNKNSKTKENLKNLKLSVVEEKTHESKLLKDISAMENKSAKQQKFNQIKTSNFNNSSKKAIV